ncbi:unnamed protein product [Urochloa humidicola]
MQSADSHSTYSYLLLLLLPPLLLIFVLRPHHNKNRNEAPPIRLPPGPWRLPVIGSLHHLFNKPLAHRAMADLARRCGAPDVMYLQLGEVPAVVVSSREAAREVLRAHDVTFASRPMGLNMRATAHEGLGIAFSPYGHRWRQLRKICAVELLGAARVRSLRAAREEEAARLVAAVAAGSPESCERPPVNVSARVAAFVADSVLRAIVGERFRRRDEFLEVLEEGLRSVKPGTSLADMFPSSRLLCAISSTFRKDREFHRKITELVNCAIEQHQERKAAVAGDDDSTGDKDLLGVMLRIQKEGGGPDFHLDKGTLKAVVLDLFGGGSETTGTTLLWTMSELMRNPAVMQKAQAEVHHVLQGKERVTEDDLIGLKFLKLVIMETLRLHAPTPLLMPRECTEQCNILGFDIPQGALVLVNAWSIGRDPKYWDQPEEFKPERFEEVEVDYKGTYFEYIPFGAGRRMCPAITFAEVNMVLALAALLYHFDWQLPSGVSPSDLDMEEDMGITVRRKRDLYLCPTIRVPPHVTA